MLGRPMLYYTLSRLQLLQHRAELVVATTKKEEDDAIITLCNQLSVAFYRGDEHHVLKRFYQVAKEYKANTIVRITGDCPLADPHLVDQMLTLFCKNPQWDYLSNTQLRSFPKGFDIEIFNFKTLRNAYKYAQTSFEKEHVTPWMTSKKMPIKCHNIAQPQDDSHFNVSVDTEEDFVRVEKILQEIYPKNPHFGYNEILELLHS